MNEKGVWRTIRGRRVFIRDGEDLYSAMKRSGKFDKVSDISRRDYLNAKTMFDFDKIRGEYVNLQKEFDKAEEDDKLEMSKKLDKLKSLKDKADDKWAIYYGGYYDEPEEEISSMSRLAGKHIDSKRYQAINNDIKNAEDGELRNIAKGNSFNVITDITNKKEQSDFRKMARQEIKTRQERAREIDKINNKDFHYAGEELYSDDPNRFGNKMRKYNDSVAKENEESAKRVQARYEKENKKVTTEQAKEFNKIAGAENTRGNIKSTKNLLNDLTKERPTAFDMWSKEEYVNAEDYIRENNPSPTKSGKSYIIGGKPSGIMKGAEDTYIVKKDGSDVVHLGYPDSKEYKKQDSSPMSEWSDTTGTGLSDKQSTALNKMSMTELRNMANEYNVDTKGKSKKQLLSALISMFNK